jgi:hypothetical protein
METKPMIPIDYAKVEALAAQGMKHEEIAYALGISPRTFYRRKKDSAEMAEAIKRGEAKGEAVATTELFKLMKGGNLGAICFYLKCRRGWSEKIKIESNNTNTTKIFLFDGNAEQAAQDGK